MIERTQFGQITIDGKTYEHDVVIQLSGAVKKRKKKLSKKIYGTSHTVSVEEIETYLEPGVTLLIIGSGQYGQLSLSRKAEQFLQDEGIEYYLDSTPRAIQQFNKKERPGIGLFHITC